MNALFLSLMLHDFGDKGKLKLHYRFLFFEFMPVYTDTPATLINHTLFFSSS